MNFVDKTIKNFQRVSESVKSKLKQEKKIFSKVLNEEFLDELINYIHKRVSNSNLKFSKDQKERLKEKTKYLLKKIFRYIGKGIIYGATLVPDNPDMIVITACIGGVIVLIEIVYEATKIIIRRYRYYKPDSDLYPVPT